MNSFYKNLSLWLVIGVIMVLLFNLFQGPKAPSSEIPFSDFLARVEDGDVSEVVIQEHDIAGRMKDGTPFHTYAPDYPNLVENLKKEGVAISARPPKQTPLYLQVLLSWAPFILLFAVWIFFMRQMQGGGNRALSFGKSRAKLQSDQAQRVTFDDVAGIPEAKEELAEIIEFLKDPKKFQHLGGRIPRGVLLMGPPGTGKTLLAKAIAGEAGVPFFSISGSEFVEMFVGVGASRVRDLFEQGKKHAPCIIFIDEIDAVGRHRGAGLGGGHDEREQTLNQLLVEMDGFETDEGVILIAATNRPDVLDPALLRPGRFDRQVVVPTPDIKGRQKILEIHAREKPLAEDVDLSEIARATPGFSGADLANLLNEAALLAARRNETQIHRRDVEEAKDKVTMGVERKSVVMTDDERVNTAYHEAGHTLVAKLIPGADPVHKVSIIPRGMALGVTQQLPEEDRYTKDQEELEASIAILMGGRSAEELQFGHVTTGASNDIERATQLARRMVCDWGMSEALGPLSFGKNEEQIFLGREIAQHRDYSEETARRIDEEVRGIVMRGYERARNLLRENFDALKRLAETLLERETLEGEEIDAILRGEELAPLTV
ncbi:MAG: ATP-dependent metallopeptidase FtsH/Yme1/Tma family protein [Nitrospirae bacterium]|nr:MAG: ATP-dependent metallopeptidase FtsH/Yme1/Tma family protein [Nitrospirota bacterium]